MKVIHITSMHEFDDDRIFQRACLGLKNEGIEVGLISQHEYTKTFEHNGVQIYPIKQRLGIKRRLLSSFDAYKIAKRTKADIYHFHDPDLLPFMLLLSMKGEKVVFDIHELYRVRFSQWKFIPKSLSKFFANTYQGLEYFFLNRMSGFTLPSKSMQNLWYKDLKKPYAVVRNIHLLSRVSKFDLKINNKEKYIIYSSGVNSPDRRNINIMKAFSILHQKYSDIILVFGGVYRPDGFEQKLKDLANELRIADRFETQAFLPYEEQFKRTSQASLGLVLLEPNEKNYIATSNRMFEYMYCGIPIITENLPEPKSVIDKTKCGIYVDSDNIEDLALQIESIYLNKDIAKKMGNNGHNAVIEEFHFEKDLKNLISLYNNILN